MGVCGMGVCVGGQFFSYSLSSDAPFCPQTVSFFPVPSLPLTFSKASIFMEVLRPQKLFQIWVTVAHSTYQKFYKVYGFRVKSDFKLGFECCQMLQLMLFLLNLEQKNNFGSCSVVKLNTVT